MRMTRHPQMLSFQLGQFPKEETYPLTQAKAVLGCQRCGLGCSPVFRRFGGSTEHTKNGDNRTGRHPYD